ncbi:hypothetical protein ACQ4PT_015877 [Festuca glaucescens]
MAETAASGRTLLLVNLAAIMERADEALLPAVYKEVGAALHATPMGLGALTLYRSFVQAACYPLAAYAAVRYNRAHVIAVGAFLWAAATFLVAVSGTFAQVAVARGLNGVGLALVTPAIQSLVADFTDDNNRGSAFGWLQLTGNIGSVIGAIFALASSLGGLFGGKMGDYLSVRFPNSGRIVLSQISSASAVPLAALLLLGLPDDSSTGVLHGLVMFIMGLSISWNGAATNNPIFAEIVPQRSRASIYALDRSFESVLASFAPPVVGFLAEHAYGYTPVSHGAGASSVARDRSNAAALAKALYTAIAIPMLLCCFIYSLLYGTYPRDRERARMDTLISSELQLINLERSHGVGECHAGRKHATVIDIEYGEEVLDADDDEQALIHHQVEQSGSLR